MSVLCFGEILWDCLPRGLFLGGAPFNVAVHLHHLGRPALPVSALGDDQFGREIRRRMGLMEIDDRFVATVDAPTGSVLVDLVDGQPSYEIVDDVAWDQIPWTEALAEAAAGAEAVVFGSLAQRHPANRTVLRRLQQAGSGLQVYDVNLRAPWDDRSVVEELAAGVDLIKLNEAELRRLTDSESGRVADLAALLRNRSGAKAVCVTAGDQGAGYLDDDGWAWADAPQVTVRDAVGAGDSFLAALLVGLLAGDPVARILERCVTLAAFVTQSDGATPKPPADLI